MGKLVLDELVRELVSNVLAMGDFVIGKLVGWMVI